MLKAYKMNALFDNEQLRDLVQHCWCWSKGAIVGEATDACL
jgi:hypothetical protein